MSKTVTVTMYPKCDFCRNEGVDTDAGYDGKTVLGPWANMCQRHFKRYGIGLGTGKGQQLVLDA